jgi:hypothetical protein
MARRKRGLGFTKQEHERRRGGEMISFLKLKGSVRRHLDRGHCRGAYGDLIQLQREFGMIVAENSGAGKGMTAEIWDLHREAGELENRFERECMCKK